MESFLPFDNPFDLDEHIAVDILKSKFSEDIDENLETSFIYLRNIDYTGQLSFSEYSYDQKCYVFKKYITRTIQELSIRQLDDTLLSFLGSDELVAKYKITSIFTSDEQTRFMTENNDMLAGIESFISSLPIYLISLGKESSNQNYDYEKISHTNSEFLQYNAILALFKYECFNILMILSSLFRRYNSSVYFYDRYFKYDNRVLADAMNNTTFSIIYSDIIENLHAATGQQ